jgi:hypothetical protein
MSADEISKTNQQPIALKALVDLCSENEELKIGSTFSCEPEDALEYIISGRVELAERQLSPPIVILQKLDWQLEYLDQIGPEWQEASRLQKFQDKAIANGARRAMVDGKQLNWISGISRLRQVFDASFEIGETSVGAIQKQLWACWHQKASHYNGHIASTKLSDAQMIEDGSVCLRRRQINFLSDGPQSGYECFPVGRVWAQYYVQLRKLKEKLEMALIECLQTGRILSVEEKSFGATLILPAHWVDNPLREPKDGKLAFVYSGDLPAAWVGAQKILKGQARIDAIKKATAWLEMEYARLCPLNIRMTSDEFSKRVATLFHLTGRACDEAWNNARIPDWGQKGRIPENNRIK